MTDLILKQTKDYEAIRKYILGCNDLYDRMADDYAKPNEFYPSLMVWVGCFDNAGNINGLMAFEEESKTVCNVHILIRKEHRGLSAYKKGSGMLNFFIKHRLPRVMKLNAKVPDIYPDVVEFAMLHGFKKEGVDRLSYLKNGKLVDRVIIGRCLNGNNIC